MLVENNTLFQIDSGDIIDGVFTAPDDILYFSDYVECNTVVEKMILPNVIRVGHRFLYLNEKLEYLEMPKVEQIGDDFLSMNTNITTLIMPNIKSIGHDFLYNNYSSLRILDIPNIKEIGSRFLYSSINFEYTHKIIKALKWSLFVDGKKVDKMEYIRRLNIKKILC